MARPIQTGGCYVGIGLILDDDLDDFQLTRKAIREIRTMARYGFMHQNMLQSKIEKADLLLEGIAGNQGLGDDLKLPEEM